MAKARVRNKKNDASVTVAGADAIEGRGGDDTIFGDNVNFDGDTSVGTAGGGDSIEGGAGADTIKAGPGADWLDGGAGSPDNCNGQAGADAAQGCETLTSVP